MPVYYCHWSNKVPSQPTNLADILKTMVAVWSRIGVYLRHKDVISQSLGAPGLSSSALSWEKDKFFFPICAFSPLLVIVLDPCPAVVAALVSCFVFDINTLVFKYSKVTCDLKGKTIILSNIIFSSVSCAVVLIKELNVQWLLMST